MTYQMKGAEIRAKIQAKRCALTGRTKKSTDSSKLNKKSSEITIRNYFKGILALTELDEKFPVNLNDIWQLVYARKDHAVRDLYKNFIEGEDFILLPKNGGKPTGGRSQAIYMLSVSCFEYFIARKVKPVFEVYRSVFHQSVAEKQKSESDPILATLASIMEVRQKQIDIEKEQMELKKTQKLTDGRVSVLEEQQSKKADIEEVLPDLEPKSLRSQINQVLRSYSKKNKGKFDGLWNDLYQEVYYTLGKDLKRRAKNRELKNRMLGIKPPKVNGMDIAEELGILPKVLVIALRMFT